MLADEVDDPLSLFVRIAEPTQDLLRMLRAALLMVVERHAAIDHPSRVDLSEIVE
jgi:hypothetical protein